MTSPVFSVAGTVLSISGSGATALTRPAVNPGDLMLMRYVLPFSDATFSPDAAWTLVDKYDPSGVFQCELGVYWKVAGASEPSTYTVSISGQGGGNNLGSAQILVYTGAASASAVNAHTNTSGAASTTIANPSVTTTVADTILIAYYGDRTDLSSETFAPASGMTQRAAGRAGDGVPWAWDDQPIATAGATGVKNATASASHAWMSVVFAIAPASAGGGSTNGTATGATLTGTGTIAGGAASGASAGSTNGTASGAALTGTATISAGTASATSGASFACDTMINNTGTVLANQAVVWSWHQAGRIGQASTSVTYGTGTINGSGALTLTGLPAGVGFALVAVRGADATTDAVYYNAGTAA